MVLKFFTSDDYVKASYKEGIALPNDWNIVKDVKLENAKKGWKEFAEIVSILETYPPSPAVDKGSETSLGERFINEVWNGTKTPAQISEEYTEVMNNGREKYAQQHPEYNQAQYKNPNWNIER